MENKKKQKKRKRIIFITIGVLLFLIMGGVISSKMNGQSLVNLIPNYLKSVLFTASFNPEDERTIGYEFLDDGKVVHIWNTQDDYFFNKSSGIQFTNHFDEYWTRNIFCLGYYNNDEWVKIKCADELEGFNRNIETDNQTYVNATLWKDISYGNYDLRLGVKYHLGLDDKNLSITIYGKNIGIDILFDLGFAWKVTDWDIPSNETNDFMVINNSAYLIKGIYDLTFKDMEESYFKGRDSTYDFGGEFLRVDWNENLNYAVKMYGNGVQEDFYVALLINAGNFTTGQEKQTTFQWIDAVVLGVSSGFVTEAPTADPYGILQLIHTKAGVSHATSPATAEFITEIGWFSDITYPGGEANFEVGLYAADGGTVPGEAGTLLYSDIINAKGTDGGWKVVSGLSWSIDAETDYWLGIYVDDSDPDSYANIAASGGGGRDVLSNQISLPNPFGGGALQDADAMYAIYAIWSDEEPPPDTTPPTYSNFGVNTTVVSTIAKFYALWNDVALHPLGQYVFSTNNTGTWVNETPVNFTTTPNWANVTKTLNDTIGNVIGYTWYANDTAGNNNNTGAIHTLTITSTDTCTYSSGNWDVDCSDYCNITTITSLPSNNLTLTGTGVFTILANITADMAIIDTNCQVINLAGDNKKLMVV